MACYAGGVLRWTVRFLLLAPASALLVAAAFADRAWWVRHVVVPACYLPPAEWKLAAFRIALASIGLVLAACAFAARSPTPGGVARVAHSIALGLCAAELGLRLLERPESRTPHPRLEWLLGAPDARTGWSFVPGRTLRFGAPGGGPIVTYDVDAHGDRAPAPDFAEDPAAPTVLVAGESIALGHGLEWKDTFAAQVGERLHAQVVNVAEGGYGSDQAWLRASDALSRLQRPIALVTTVLPVQLHRNLDDARPHLVLRDGALVLAPAFRPRLRLRELIVDELQIMPSWRIANSEALTRAILSRMAEAARAHGARPLFVAPVFGRAPALLRELLAGLPSVTVELDPARIMPWDGHPDARGARQIADAVVAALQ